MPLFIDCLPFSYWQDRTRTPPLGYWTVVLPVLLTEPNLLGPPLGAVPQEWVLDIGNRGEGFAWRHHLVTAGIDPDQNRLPSPVSITTAIGGKTTVPVRRADLWLVSNLPAFANTPHRMALQRGLPFQDTTVNADPSASIPLEEFQKELLGEQP